MRSFVLDCLPFADKPKLSFCEVSSVAELDLVEVVKWVANAPHRLCCVFLDSSRIPRFSNLPHVYEAQNAVHRPGVALRLSSSENILHQNRVNPSPQGFPAVRASSRMRVPFPLALRIGTDIIATNRISSLLQPDIRRLVRLTNRFLVPPELEDLGRRFPHWKDADAQDQLVRKQVAAWIAGRWASKEAAKKAWDASLLSFRDLRVGIESGGAVHIVCDTRLTTSTTSDHSMTSTSKVTAQTAQLSISHDGDYAIATVLATPLHPDISAELGRRKAEAEAKVKQLSGPLEG